MTLKDTKDEKPADAKNGSEKEKKAENKDGCAVDGCPEKRYGRGYCCIHMITNRENEIPDPPQRVRTTLNLWYRREDPDAGKITWKFVHLGHRHEINFYHERVGIPRRVKVDQKEIDGTGNITKNGDWWTKLSVGRGESLFSCYLVQIYRHEAMLTDLVIDGRSFSHSRDKFISAICEAQVKQINRMNGITDPNDMTLHLKERKNLEEKWTREEYISKTRRGYNKVVTTWVFFIDGERQELTLEHGQTGGKKKIIHNEMVKFERKKGLLESNTSCAIPLSKGIKGREVRCIIKDLKRMRSKGILHSEDDHYEKLANFDYDLEIDHIPWSLCTLCTFDLAQPGRSLPRSYDTGITDRELRAVMKQVKQETMGANPKRDFEEGL